MTVTIRPYVAEDARWWDLFVEQSYNGTFLHTRRYLAYHRDRFQDVSLLVETQGKIIGVFPAALNPNCPDQVISHPGITYGGVVHSGRIKGQAMISALERIFDYYRDLGLTKLFFKAVPYIYHKVPTSDDLYALFRLGAQRYRCDLSATIDFRHRVSRAENRRRNLQKANKSGLVISKSHNYLSVFWSLLEGQMSAKHRSKPVHSIEEMDHLAGLFPNNIECTFGLLDDEVVAGTIIFKTERVAHLQYASASARGYEVSALDLLLETDIGTSLTSGKHYFDFGISNENAGKYLNEGLYQFKTGFGAGGVVHEFYKISLKDSNES